MRSLGRYLVLFLASGVIVGAVVAVVAHNRSARGDWLVIGLGGGVVFGLVMTAVLGALDALMQRGGGRATSRSPRQRVTLRSTAPPEVLVPALRAAVGALPAQVLSDELPRGPLRARTSFSWRSYGERIAVEIHPDGAGADVTLSSRPVVPTTLIDFGKSRTDVEELMRAVESLRLPGARS